jgi:hypothetical protein
VCSGSAQRSLEETDMRHRRRYRRPNPSSGLSTDTIVLLGFGTVLLGAIVYGIFEISETNDTLASTNNQIASATQTAQGISQQIPGATEAAQNVATSVSGATQTAQQVQQSPVVTAAQSVANWWNQL